MQVKNIVITGDKKYFIEILIKELIDNCISYVQIDNEFHFEDKIIRIYDKKDYQEAVASTLATDIISLININIEKNQQQYKPENSLVSLDEGKYFTSSVNKPNGNKRLIKEQNRLANRKIKNNFRNNHR